MPLLDLKTDLKSIKYGHDRPGGGDSNQPYIKTDINTVDKGINRLRLTNFDDGLIRGGIIGMLNSSVTDTLRIGKFLTDFPKGPLFIVKQVGLQLSNPRLESKQVKVDRNERGGGFFTNTINSVANVAGKIENAVGPTRIYNLGINTLAQVPLTGIGGHIVRHGFLPVADPSKYYETVVTANNKNDTNRLVGLATRFELGRSVDGEKSILRKSNKFNNFIKSAAAIIATGKFKPDSLVINSYIGGPGSVYGIGSTLIRRATTPEGANFDTSNNAGRPLINGERQAFTYIDPLTFNGAISSGLGQRNSTSGFNTANHIGGIAYNTPTVDKFGAFFDTITDQNELAKGVDQSVNVNGYVIPSSLSHVNNSITDANINLRSGSFYGVSNYSGSDLRTFLFLTSSLPISKSPFAPLSLNGFDINNNKGLYNRDSNLTPIENKNDLVKKGPSSYPSASNTPFKYSLALPNLVYGSLSSSYTDIKKATDKLTSPNNVGIYERLVSGQSNDERLPNSINNPIYKNKLNNPDVVVVQLPWIQATRELRVGSGRQDLINLTPILDGIDKYDGKDKHKGNNHRDLVKFRIQAVNTDGPGAGSLMVFRAYITALTDSVDATWNPVKYAGRGDSFYIYDGFSRKMSVSFKVAALSEQEMKPMYQKLNFLMGNLMPDYGTGNLMRGPLVRMTIGNYIDAQLCKLDSLSITIPNDSPWEIAINDDELILPHIIEVQLSFTPIGSETSAENKISEKSQTTSHIAQNNTGDIARLKYI